MSITLSQSELQQMRDSVNELYPDVCNVLSVSSVSDGEGGMAETWGTVTRNLPCRMDAVSMMRESPTDGSLRAFHSYELTVSYDANIGTNNRIEFNGSSYNIISVNDSQSWSIEKTLQVERLS